MRLFNVVLLALLVGVVGCESREQEARRKQIANNMKQLGAALEAYDPQNAAAGTETTSEAAAENVERPALKTMKFSGEAIEFHRSPDGKVDGIALKDGTEVRFPADFGEEVTDIVSIGYQVELVGWTHAGEGEVHAASVTNVGSGKSLEVDQLPPDLPD